MANPLARAVRQPPHDCVYDVLLLAPGEWPAGLDPVPLGEARAAAGPGCMLGNKDRMAAPGRLLPVIVRRGGREALRDEVLRMPANERGPAPFKIGAILFPQPEAG